MAPWKLPVIVAAIAVPIAVAFAVGGPGAGVAIGAIAGIALVVIAALQRPRRQIVAADPDGPGRRVLVVVTCAVDDPGAVAEIVGAAGLGDDGDGAEVLVLAPARIGFLDRWASDVESARHRAQQNLVATVAALAKAGVAAEARVGDEDVVQAVEDQLQSYPASEVVLVGEDSGEGKPTSAAAAELAARLQPEFRRVVLSAG